LLGFAGLCWALLATLNGSNSKKEMEHGAWLPWLKDNFGWSEDTAQKYINVAKAFQNQIPSRAVFDINIDAKALYLLASNGVSEADT
jgi:hypothetical protein